MRKTMRSETHEAVESKHLKNIKNILFVKPVTN